MSEHAKKPLVAGPQAVDPATDDPQGEPLSEATAARLRGICEQTGEAYDGNLTETQAQRRIATLSEAHGVSV